MATWRATFSAPPKVCAVPPFKVTDFFLFKHHVLSENGEKLLEKWRNICGDVFLKVKHMVK